uniref:Ovule protein n=1 Tax=Ascaris lumbricoides TaxID=6252 RepID=A0A0M3I866_ASCLU
MSPCCINVINCSSLLPVLSHNLFDRSSRKGEDQLTLVQIERNKAVHDVSCTKAYIKSKGMIANRDNSKMKCLLLYLYKPTAINH